MLKFESWKLIIVCNLEFVTWNFPKSCGLWAGQYRLTLITDNEGCVRYPTEGNNSLTF